MAFNEYQSDDELLNSYATPSSTDPASMSNSGNVTPLHDVSNTERLSPKKKKSVRYNLSEEEEQELRDAASLLKIPSRSSSGGASPPILRPRSVLKKGNVTPTNENLEEGIEDLDVKQRSAVSARKRASRLLKSESEECEGQGSSPKPHNPDFYYPKEQLASGQVTPIAQDADYVEKPIQWRMGGLSMARMEAQLRDHDQVWSDEEDGDLESGRSTPKHSPRSSVSSLSKSGSSQSSLLSFASNKAARLGRLKKLPFHRSRDENDSPQLSSQSQRPKFPRSLSSSFIDTLGKISWPHKHKSHTAKAEIKRHINDTKEARKYILKLCQAMMEFGAPTHRLEEYMRASATSLNIAASFLYLPGCMIVSFEDPITYTTDVQLVRTAQGVDLGKLYDVHKVYKDVIHGMDAVQANEQLRQIVRRKTQYTLITRILWYGVASSAVGPFAFGARLLDLPIAFILGCVVGFLHLYMAPRSDLYANVFENVAVALTSFAARGFGSIQDGKYFCFSSLAQSSIAIILPGYTVLCGALELQARSMIAGSVRLVFAIIYSLWIGLSLAIGTSLYGAIDHGATSAITCKGSLPEYTIYPAVIAFSLSLMVINQAKLKQMPVMLVISLGGYAVNRLSAQQFHGNAQVASFFGSLAIGFMANLYSRIGHRLDRPAENCYAWIKERSSTLFKGKVTSVPSVEITPSALESQDEKTATRNLQDTKSDLPHAEADVEPQSAHQTTTSQSVEEKSIRSSTEDEAHSTSANPSGLKDAQSRDKNSKDHPGTQSKHEANPRTAYSLAAAAMLPAIFVQVPSGLSVSGSLAAGLKAANQITGKTGPSNDVVAGTGVLFTVASSVVQIAIGMTVGLFVGTLLVYPRGKGGKANKKAKGGLSTY